MTMPVLLRKGEVEIRDLSKAFAFNGGSLHVLDGIDVSVPAGSTLAIVGPSGSKTTLLRVLAGLEFPDLGQVLIDGRPVRGVGTDRAVIFQEPRLLPWLTVLGNVAFGLEVRGRPRAEAEAKARDAIRLVGLSAFEAAYPAQLSGGMAQRVGIARALTVSPEILLLDEPLGALDAMTKMTMQEELARIGREQGLTMILVTHDLEEAVYLADLVLVLPRDRTRRARVVDIDLPRPRERGDRRFVGYREALMREFGLH